MFQLIPQAVRAVNGKRQIAIVVENRTDNADGRADLHLVVVDLIATVLHQKIGSAAQQASGNILILFCRQRGADDIESTGKIGMTVGFTQRLRVGFTGTVIRNTAVFFVVRVVFCVLHQDIGNFIEVFIIVR